MVVIKSIKDLIQLGEPDSETGQYKKANIVLDDEGKIKATCGDQSLIDRYLQMEAQRGLANLCKEKR